MVVLENVQEISEGGAGSDGNVVLQELAEDDYYAEIFEVRAEDYQSVPNRVRHYLLASKERGTL